MSDILAKHAWKKPNDYFGLRRLSGIYSCAIVHYYTDKPSYMSLCSSHTRAEREARTQRKLCKARIPGWVRCVVVPVMVED